MNTLKQCAAGFLSIVSLSVLTMAGCAAEPASDTGDDEVSAIDNEGEAVDGTEDALTYDYRIECVKKVNGFRATLGLPALARRTDKEACADAEAKKDFMSKVPHGAFGQCGEFGQCECPNWGGATNQTIVNGCMQQMWNEGPGTGNAHGHYNIMSSKNYKGVACGIYRANGNVWALQNYF